MSETAKDINPSGEQIPISNGRVDTPDQFEAARLRFKEMFGEDKATKTTTGDAYITGTEGMRKLVRIESHRDRIEIITSGDRHTRDRVADLGLNAPPPDVADLITEAGASGFRIELMRQSKAYLHRLDRKGRELVPVEIKPDGILALTYGLFPYDEVKPPPVPNDRVEEFLNPVDPIKTPADSAGYDPSERVYGGYKKKRRGGRIIQAPKRNK